MELDLSWLDEIGKKEPLDSLPLPFSDEDAATAPADPVEGAGRLQRQADINRAEREQCAQILREYQENMKSAGMLTTEIIKGVQTGADVYDLFLKAVKALSLVTGNSALSDFVKEYTVTVYGSGLGKEQPLRIELQQVQDRLDRLREAAQRAGEPLDSIQRIQNAIKAHEQRADVLKQLIEKAERE